MHRLLEQITKDRDAVKSNSKIRALLTTIVIAICSLIISVVDAQDGHVHTEFRVLCLEGLSEDHYRLHILISSDGVDTLAFRMGDVIGITSKTASYTGDATTNIPQSFTILYGQNTQFYLDAHSEDSPYTFSLIFTNDLGDAILLVNTWDNVPACAAIPNILTPLSIPNPVIDSCPAWALDSATNTMVCLWSLPKAHNNE